MRKLVRKPARKARQSVEPFGLVQIRRINLHLNLSPSGVRGARTSLERAFAAGRSGPVQLRLNARDLNSISLCLEAAQAKNLRARLKALTLGDRRTR